MYYFKLVVLLCFTILPVAMTFNNCPPLPPRNISTSIKDLHPSDIKVMMAMGDSITAGFGVMSSWNESRGRSFSIGGDSGAVTLPSLFRNFNPAVVGYSNGDNSADVCHGDGCAGLKYFPDQDSNNAAKSGSMVFDMVSMQVNYLIRQINLQPYMDVSQDWKVLTIMIGANDLCASCAFNLTYLSPDDYENNLFGTLERIRSSLPRTFVNLVPGFNISQAYDLSLSLPRCANVTRPLFIQCDCLFNPAAGAVRETVDALMTTLFDKISHISELPPRFLSRLDCFHPSGAGQEAMAVALWNSMLTPAADKQTSLNMSDEPICPTEDTLLYTY